MSVAVPPPANHIPPQEAVRSKRVPVRAPKREPYLVSVEMADGSDPYSPENRLKIARAILGTPAAAK